MDAVFNKKRFTQGHSDISCCFLILFILIPIYSGAILTEELGNKMVIISDLEREIYVWSVSLFLFGKLRSLLLA